MVSGFFEMQSATLNRFPSGAPVLVREQGQFAHIQLTLFRPPSKGGDFSPFSKGADIPPFSKGGQGGFTKTTQLSHFKNFSESLPHKEQFVRQSPVALPRLTTKKGELRL